MKHKLSYNANLQRKEYFFNDSSLTQEQLNLLDLIKENVEHSPVFYQYNQNYYTITTISEDGKTEKIIRIKQSSNNIISKFIDSLKPKSDI
jgi:lipopolysaccharide export LptBFGC system permease protein LptF